MDIILFTVRLLIAGVFLLSGLAKLANRKGSQQTLVDFGVPKKYAKPSAIVLPLFELTVAVLLIPTTSAWWAAIFASFLFLLFIIVISINLIKGNTPECNCFGQLHSKPIGWPTLIRNGVLLSISAFMVIQGQEHIGLSAFSWFGDLTPPNKVIFAISIVVFGMLIIEGWLLLNLMRQNGRLLLRVDALEAYFSTEQKGLAVGEVAPSFQLVDLYGEKITLKNLGATNLPVVLIFWDPNCGPCDALLPEISYWQREYASLVTITLISRGDPEANLTKTEALGVTGVLLQRDKEVASAFQVKATPAAVHICSDGRIGSRLAIGGEPIKALVTRLAATTPAAMPVKTENNGHE